MNISYNTYRQPEIPTLYLAGPDGQFICPLNAIRPESARLTLNLNDTSELSFTYDKYIDVYGVKVPSNGYDLLDDFMKIYVEHIGWFLMSTPQICDDGRMETKQVFARSADIGLTNQDLVGFKINCGTSDSLEVIHREELQEAARDSVDTLPSLPEQIKFCDFENPKFSLLHQVLEFAQVEGWSIGYIDEIPKVYRSYSDGSLEESVVQLKDEIGTFDIGSQSVYSFLTQDVEQFFECIILFDIETMTINAYRPENLGKDTNVTIGFRNLKNSHDISVDKDSIYTRCRVQGDDDLGIEYVNFGSNTIENLSYFLNTRYMDEALIHKYKAWRSDVESKRLEYMDYSRRYNEQLNVLSELTERIPLDDCSTQWNRFSNEELKKAKDNYLAEKEGYESFYLDESGNFDEEKLASSPDADTYYQIRDVILPSIDIEFANRKLPTSEGQKPYIDTYKTDWKLYGLDELSVYLDFYRTQKADLEKEHYDLSYEEYEAASYPAHTRDMHEQMHTQYQDVTGQLDETFSGSCAAAYKERLQEYEAARSLSDELQNEMHRITSSVEKENWSVEGTEPFTRRELRTLNKLYRDTDYTNDHMFLTSFDDQVSAIDEQLKLFDAASADLETISQPQYTYQTDLDNFLALYDYKDYAEQLELGDFLYLGTQDDYLVKLRLISCSYNPLMMDNHLQIEFSNMIRTGSKRYDTTYLLGLSGNTSKNSITGSSNSSSRNEGTSLTAGLIRKLLASSLFQGNISNAVSQHFNALKGQLIVADNLETEMIDTVDINAENGFFQYLQSQLIAADKIVADSAVISNLSATTARIQNAITGTTTADTGIIVTLNSENAVIDEAFLKKVIADYISVNDLKAGHIDTNQINIVSSDGSFSMVGNLMQFKDKDGLVRIQIGKDHNDNFTFIVYDASGKGVLLDQDGLHESAISDGLIQGNMIAGNAIGKENIDWNSCGAATDSNDNPVWNAAQVTVNGEGLDVQFSSISDNLNQVSNEMNGVKTQMSGVESQVNAVNQSIDDKVWRTDFVEVQDEEGNSVNKTIVDLLTEHHIGLDGVSSSVAQIESENGTLKQTVSNMQQTTEEFRQTVSSTYATKDGIKQKQDIPLTSIRYIRDWLDGTGDDAENRWVECQVISDETNIASGLLPKCLKSDGSIIELSNPSVYTDGALLPSPGGDTGEIETASLDEALYYISVSEGKSCLELDLGTVRSDIDYIQIWHYYTDNRIFNHELQVSADGQNWTTLYDSRISGGYTETSQGNVHYLTNTSILSGLSLIQQAIDNIHTEVRGTDDQFTLFNQDLESISSQVASNKDYAEEVNQKLSELSTNYTNQYNDLSDSFSQIQETISSISQTVARAEANITYYSQIIQDAQGWKALFAQLGMGDSDKIQTSVSIDKDGITVTNPADENNKELKTQMTTNGLSGWYDNLPVFQISKDTTITRRLVCEKGWDTGSIKMTTNSYRLPDGSTVKGIAYVKSGGTS